MKHTNVILLCIIALTTQTTTMQSPSTPLQQITKKLSEGRPSEQVMKTLRSMDIGPAHINDIIATLARYYNGDRTWAALLIGIPAALDWFKTQPAKEWFKDYYNEHSAMLNQYFTQKLDSHKHVFSLLDIGFNPNVKIAGYGHTYQSPLDVAFDNKDLELFKRLLAAGADPNSMNTIKNEIIIEKVARSKNIPFLKALITAGANRNPILVNGQPLIQSLEERQRNSNTTEYNTVIKLLRTGFWQADSLTQQTINELAKQIKDGKLKLENAKKRIPQDLHEALEKALQEAILIARVSTEEQRDAGNSLPAQVARLERYCQSKGYIISKSMQL